MAREGTPLDSPRRPTLSSELEAGILVVSIDRPDHAVNTLSPALAREFEDVCTRVEQDPLINGVVLISGKPDGFIAGADVEQFREFRSAKDAEQVSVLGHALLARIERLRAPVVAAIHGACLGGGLELTLACGYRICTDHPKTVLALPEVQLGVIPGMGGTQRLPKLIGLQGALDMILTGRNIRARRALQMGLVDELVHPSILRDVAIARATALGERTLKRPTPRSHGLTGLLLQDNPLGRSVVFRKAAASVLAKTHGHYPAPLAALDVIRAGYDRGFDAGIAEEARRFGELAVSDVSRELVYLFFASNALKKDAGVPEPAPTPRVVHRLGILGAGFMGSGIAAIAVQRGTLVRLKDTDQARLARGLRGVRDVLVDRLAKRQITRLQYSDMLVLAGATTDYSGFGAADIVIEAVFEDLDVKHAVLRETEPLLDPDAVYASNTSTIPIGSIAAAAIRPERVLGMHFFSPVHKMPLLEVIVTPQTSPEAAVTAVAYGKELGKTVIVVNDGPGFYTTRILSAYMNEAGWLLDQGAAIEDIDGALVDFGFPVGPIALLDEVGIDIGGKVGRVLADAFGARMAPSNAMRQMVESGRTGRKGRSGFYRYDAQGEKSTVDPSVYQVIGRIERHPVASQEIVQRCVLALVNEAAKCLEEGILRSPRDGDIGAVFGIGFPPFRGGPFRYVDSVGADRIVDQLEELNVRFPQRFTPPDALIEVGQKRRRFHAEH
jgi:3-hydroxyacyl-CoA dehydrogenase / enoyl-CoA hydratase / 3-hydroxybutyryl-CoA epimerase